MKERFFTDVDIDKGNIAVLEEINERILAGDKLSKSMTEAYRTGRQVADDLEVFRKQAAQISQLDAEGKDIPDLLKGEYTKLGDALVFIHSTRRYFPKSMEELMANAPKMPTAPVIREITKADDIAALAEDVAEDINFLISRIGEKEMRKHIGVIDSPWNKFRTGLGFADKSPELEAMQKLHQRVQQLGNITLKLRSGAQVTESEAARFLKEFADPSREDYFRRLDSFAKNERKKAQEFMQKQMDAGYIFNRKLRSAVFGAKPKGAESKLNALESQRYEQMKAMDQKLFSDRQRRAFEVLKKKAGD